MCDCKEVLESKFLEKFKEQYPNAQEHQATLTGYMVLLAENRLFEKGCMPLEFNALHPMKNGGNKKKTLKQTLAFTYCPFCGQEYKTMPSKDNEKY